MMPAGQLVTGFETGFEDANIWRRNRARTITVFADPKVGLASPVFLDVKARIERALNVDLAQVLGKSYGPEENPLAGHDASAIPVKEEGLLPLKDMPGYSMTWGGEAEDSARSQASLAKKFPPIIGIMVFIVIWLFNSIRKSAIIWLCVPLAVIGVTVGLLITRQPFGFMSLLGLLSLSGMLIKNAIVLIDQITIEMRERHGAPPHGRLLHRHGGDHHVRPRVRHGPDPHRRSRAVRNILPGAEPREGRVRGESSHA
jgi:multidrug efflux pump subunit AcrB